MAILVAAAGSAIFGDADNPVGALLNSSLGAQSPSAKSSEQKSATGPQRITLTPQYTQGQIVRYRMQATTITDTHHGGAIRDPQGPTKMTVVWNAITRLEVLSMQKNAQGDSTGTMRLRSTYEKSDATSESGSYDPEADGIAQKYRALEGKSFEFTVDAAGQISDIEGFEGGDGPGSPADAIRASLGQISSGANGPRGGIIIGQTWITDLPVPSAPLAGLIWRSHSTYQRNEPCQLAATANSPAPTNDETCAVILTKLTLVSARPGKEATPENYRKMGLTTAGTWTGEGDTLSYVSINSGRLVSVTQSSTEHMDFTVTHEGGERMSYQGSVQSHSQLALLPPTP
jgi:hypothetical protein|nr:hypothetical protein [Candidatus Acidoferrales bacterium]